ncbi:MAG: hypothetical protein FIB02_02290 [Desulfuromonas sp.]|nr:hypothetical protein [Desulfuromonas sp.]
MMHGLQRKDIPRYVAGLLAGILALFYLTAKRTDASVVIPSVYFIIACAIDTIKAKIPTTLNASLAIAGLALLFNAAGWPGLLNGLLGLTLGIALLLVP